jgi:conjugative transfer signal peptidase TraF
VIFDPQYKLQWSDLTMIKKKIGTISVLIWGVVILLIVLSAAFAMLGISIGINPTQSQPYRFFLILKKAPFQDGDLVAFRFPGSRYYEEGLLFVKEIEGMPGDHLAIREDRTAWLNGEFLDQVRAADSQGQPVEPYMYDGVIPEGRYFLYAPAPKSYDSRYYGLIERERIVGKVIPLF